MLDAASWRVTLETERLLLVPQTPDDAAEMAVVLGDRALHAFTGGRPRSADTLRRRYERLAAGTSPDGSEVWANWTLRLRAGGAAIGYVQATVGDAGADLAWVVGTPWQRQGYAGEAAQALAGFLREAGVAPLTARVDPRHVASRRVAARAGLVPTGQLGADGEELWSSPPTGPLTGG